MSQVYHLSESLIALDWLDQFNLSESIFYAAIGEGIYEFHKTTKLHPRTDGGVRAWGAIIAGLRFQLLSKNGWNYDRHYGLELTYNSNLNINIIVTTGDRYTGCLDKPIPKTKNKKGAATSHLVHANYDLFADDYLSKSDVPKIDSTETWILLYYFDYGKREVRFEFSMPIGLSGTDDSIKVSSWQKRVIFVPIPFETPLGKLEKEVGFSDDVDINITKKSV